jgi:hypothetical protein
MATENSNTPDRPTEVNQPAKSGDDNLKTARNVDNKVIEKQRLMEAQDFSVTKVDSNAIKQANQAPQSAFQVVDGGAVLAASKKSEAQAQPDRAATVPAGGETVYGASGHKELPSSKANHSDAAAEKTRDKQPNAIKPGEIEMEPGVSQKRRDEVEHWWQSVPPHLREAVLNSHCKARIIVNVDQSPALKQEASTEARGHHETIDQLPMFYSPSLNRIIFADKASRTAQEQQVQKKVDTTIEQQERGGVKTYGGGKENLNNFDVKSLSYASIERNGWHEMGHAIDQAVLHKFSASKDFKSAFAEGVASLNATDRASLSYFVNNKDELFAEVFALKHTPAEKRTPRDQLIVDHFSKLIKVMHDEAKVKDSAGHEHALF